MLLFAGELGAAASLIQQLQPAIEATGSKRVPYSALGLSAFAGRQAEAATQIDAITADVRLRGEGVGHDHRRVGESAVEQRHRQLRGGGVGSPVRH